MDIKIKRIIDGKTYNTETATRLVSRSDDGEDDGWEVGRQLYQTRFGAFFLVEYFYWNGEDDREKIIPLTADEARSWLEENAGYDVALIERLFGEMPEAGSGESKFTLRMPDSLRERLAERAKSNNQSLNAWIIRCLESCAAAHDAGDVPPTGNIRRGSDGVWRPKG